MKVVFDKHVPTTIVKLFLGLTEEKVVREDCKDLTFKQASDYEPKHTDKDYIAKNDAPWLDRYAADGGHAVISGDTKMKRNHHEKLALYENGFVTIFFESKWNNWDFYKKSAILLHWWPEICAKIKSADKGTFWVIPSEWPHKNGQLRNISMGLAQLLKDNPDRKERKLRRKGVRRKGGPRQAETRQTDLLEAEGSGAKIAQAVDAEQKGHLEEDCLSASANEEAK